MGDDGGGGARDTRANHDTAACNLGRRFDFHKYTCSHQGAAGGDSHSIDYEDVVGGALGKYVWMVLRAASHLFVLLVHLMIIFLLLRPKHRPSICIFNIFEK